MNGRVFIGMYVEICLLYEVIFGVYKDLLVERWRHFTFLVVSGVFMSW